MKLLAPFATLVLALAAIVHLDDTPAGADLVFVNQNEVFTLDPQRMSYLQDLRLAHVLYEGLVRWDNADYSILPACARALPAISADGLTYTFELRENARWSNGDPVTAHDYVYSWKRAVLPDSAADYSSLFFALRGAEAFFAWRTAQTARFVADPWSDDAPPSSRRAAVERLEGLLAATDLHEDVALPAERDVVAAELARLRAAIDTDHPGSAPAPAAAAPPRPAWRAALHDADRVRAWWEQLDAPASRAGEAAWMWTEAERHFDRTVGLRATGPRTLVVELRQPTAYFLDLLCFGIFFPVHRPTVEGWPVTAFPAGWHASAAPPLAERRWVGLDAGTGRLSQAHEWARPERFVGNGTHVLATWRYKRDLRLERNPHYHDPDRVRPDSILALTIEDTNTAVLAFESGRVDWLADVSADYEADMIAELDAYVDRHRAAYEAVRAEGLAHDTALARLPAPDRGERRNIHVIPTFGTDFYNFNCRPALRDGRPNPFADAAVRRAFARSIDKQVIVDQVTRLREPVLDTLIPPGSIPGYAGPAGLGYDPDAARRDLARAGWRDRDGDGALEDEDGAPFPVIDLLYTTNTPRYEWISLELKAQWERELGVPIELRGVETKFYKEDLKQGKFMIARGRWYGDYGDPTTFLDICRTTDGNNDRQFTCPRFDELLDRAALERDPATRMRMLGECERILFEEEMPMLVLCQLVQVVMYEPGRVTGLSDHPRLTQFLWQMQVDDG